MASKAYSRIKISCSWIKFSIKRQGLLLHVDSIDDEKYFSCYDIPRDDPNLVQVVEELGEASWGSAAELKVIEIPVHRVEKEVGPGKWTKQITLGN